MKNYEKKALFKFTAIYFFSVSILVIVLGLLYFWQQKHLLMKNTVMQMLQYSQLVVKTDFAHIQKGFSYELKSNQKVVFDAPKKTGDLYIKAFPISQKEGYIIVKTDAEPIDEKIYELKIFTISIQAFLLFLLLLLSYFLAKKSLEPIQEMIKHLDSFILDLIHDLNTPATSILLNTNLLLKNEEDEKKQKKLSRIKLSADTIASLYKNLEIILDHKLEETDIDFGILLSQKIEDFKLHYPNIYFDFVQKDKSNIRSNEKALSRIIDNILSNACKYTNQKEPKVQIIFENQILYIIDNGKGVQYPSKIFQREYKESQKGHGIGMHIVHKLCDNLDIKISVNSKQNQGTTVILKF